jgi:hypothetical protein
MKIAIFLHGFPSLKFDLIDFRLRFQQCKPFVVFNAQAISDGVF